MISANSSIVRRCVTATILCLAFACLPSISLAEIPPGLAVSITPSQSKYSAKDALFLTVRYTNTTTQTIKLLKWGTALEGRVNDDFLLISGSAGVMPYVGRHYKRAAPVASDYVSIAPGAYKEMSVDISDAYDLALEGRYQVRSRYNSRLNSAQNLGSVAEIKLSEDRLVRLLKRPPAFQNCAGSRPSAIDSAVSAAEAIARVARDSLRATPVTMRSSARRYKEWFGVYSSGRWNTVQSNFDKIYSALSTRTLKFICDDTTAAYAYVYPSQPYDIYLGRAFWPAPRTGTDSKAGTIVHELSHFRIIADTEDFRYGQFRSRILAMNLPNDAIRNADNHEYFAENTPGLSMPKPADLVIASGSLSNSNPLAGQDLSVSGAIQNQGAGTSPATSLSLKLIDALNSQQVTQIAIPAIVQGGSSNFQLNFKAPSVSGEYTAELCVLVVDGEANTNNNCSVLPKLLVKPLVITPIIDLILQMP